MSCRDNSRLLFGKARKAPVLPSNYLIQELDHFFHPTIFHHLNATWFQSIQTLERVPTNHSFFFPFQRTSLEPFVLCRPERNIHIAGISLQQHFCQPNPRFTYVKVPSSGTPFDHQLTTLFVCTARSIQFNLQSRIFRLQPGLSNITSD